MATDHHQHHGSSHGEDGAGPINHETSDISLDNVGKLTIGFALVLFVVLGVMYGTYRMLDQRATALDPTRQRAIEYGRAADAVPPPVIHQAPNAMDQIGRPLAGPKLLTNEPDWLSGVRAQQRQVLTSYAWVDKEAGTVRLPIERAKQLIAERGLPSAAPAAPEADTSSATPPAPDAPQ